MARIDDLNSYELAFRVAMMTRGYKSSLVVLDEGSRVRGVLLTHPDTTFRFRVEGSGFSIETPKVRTRGYGVTLKEYNSWSQVRHVFTDEENAHYRENNLIPDLDDGQLVARIEAAIKANDDEEAMRGIRQARRMALREAAPDMWKALRVIVMTPAHKNYLEEFDPQALKQCQDALINAGTQDPEDLSVARSGLSGY